MHFGSQSQPSLVIFILKVEQKNRPNLLCPKSNILFYDESYGADLSLFIFFDKSEYFKLIKT